jgi:hypothetical protein
MKILHKIEKFPSQIQERRFGLHLTDMNVQEYDNIRSLLHTIFKYGQFDNREDLVKQSGVTHSLSNVTVYDSNRITDFNI